MGINVNFNPADPFGKKQDKLNERNWQASESQRALDNSWRTKMYWEDLRRYQKSIDRDDNKIQRLAADARKAGVSTMAALGGSAQSPAHISMPAGQGGRVSGNYQRNSGAQLSLTMDMLKKSKYEANIEELKYYSLLADVRSKNRRWNQEIGLLPPDEKNVYIEANDNYEQATQWIKEGKFVAVNPDLNLEMPESVGGYYFAKPRPEGWLNY